MIRKYIVIWMMLCTLLSFSQPVHAVVPLYAKWGKIAMQETSSKYQASIVDYLHVGRTQVAENITEEKFKLWLRKQNQEEFGVYVTIRFNSNTEQIIGITFVETSH